MLGRRIGTRVAQVAWAPPLVSRPEAHRIRRGNGPHLVGLHALHGKRAWACERTLTVPAGGGASPLGAGPGRTGGAPPSGLPGLDGPPAAQPGGRGDVRRSRAGALRDPRGPGHRRLRARHHRSGAGPTPSLPQSAASGGAPRCTSALRSRQCRPRHGGRPVRASRSAQHPHQRRLEIGEHGRNHGRLPRRAEAAAGTAGRMASGPSRSRRGWEAGSRC